MKIDKKLNIILPIERGTITIPAVMEGDQIKTPAREIPNIEGYIYSIPLSLAEFEANYELIGATYTKILTGGLGSVAGPRTAGMILKGLAAEWGVPEKAEGLLNDIRRLSVMATSTAAGWEQVPLAEALSRKLLDADEVSEVENALAFFIVASAMTKKQEMRQFFLGMASIWDAQPASSSFSEFLNSLPTLTATVSSTKKEASSVPR